jgi:hypothetical protein
MVGGEQRPMLQSILQHFKGGAMARKTLASALIALAMAIAYTACNSQSLVGEWRRTDKDEHVVFQKDGTLIVTGQDEVMVLKWRAEKGKLIMEYPLLTDPVVQRYKVSGSTLTTTDGHKRKNVATYKRI